MLQWKALLWSTRLWMSVVGLPQPPGWKVVWAHGHCMLLHPSLHLKEEATASLLAEVLQPPAVGHNITHFNKVHKLKNHNGTYPPFTPTTCSALDLRLLRFHNMVRSAWNYDAPQSPCPPPKKEEETQGNNPHICSYDFFCLSMTEHELVHLVVLEQAARKMRMNLCNK